MQQTDTKCKLLKMKIRKKTGDLGFAFAAAHGTSIHWPYLCVVRPKGSQVFLEAYGNHLFHFSFHRPRLGADVADCHYSVPKELVRDSIVSNPAGGPDRIQSPWKRRVGTDNVHAALHLIFPAQFALDDFQLPNDGTLQGCQVECFDVPAILTLRCEALFGPQDDKSWEARFHNYGDRQKYFDLDNGERFCLNFYHDDKDYSVYQPTDEHKKVMVAKAGEPPVSAGYGLLFGPHGHHAIGVVHGSPEQV